MAESLTLKWGTIKGWNCNGNKEMRSALQKWSDEGYSLSAMAQRNTETQKQSICDAIDACNGEIWNDWTGEKMSKEEAKSYIKEYKR